jgi:hypothetical protein
MKKSNRTSYSYFFWLLLLITVIFFAMGALNRADAMAKPPKSKFYDFSDQVIDGELKKPTALYTNARKKVEFDRLLNLKKSFIPNLMNSAKDKVLK